MAHKSDKDKKRTLCMYSVPSRSCFIYSLIWLGCSLTRSFSNNPARSWSIYGNTIYTDNGLSFPLPISDQRWQSHEMIDNVLRTTNMSSSSTTLECLRALSIFISRNAVTGIPSFSLCMRMRFNATSLPVGRCFALWTSLRRPSALSTGRKE